MPTGITTRYDKSARKKNKRNNNKMNNKITKQ